MSDSAARSEVVLQLAEEFLERYRAGERPSLKDYVARHPELAGEIREVFPAMALMENIALADESLAGFTPRSETLKPAMPLEQLGDYRIIREIGRGGMGVVYEAEQVSLGRHVALKVLTRNLLPDAKTRQRFEREARAAAKLHHTNIVPIFGVGEHDGLPYYVMQFIQGLGLDQVLEELQRQQPVSAQANGAARAQPTGERTAAAMAGSLLTGEFDNAAVTNDYAPAREGTNGAGRTLADSFTLSSSSVVLPGQSGISSKSRRKKQTYWQRIAQIGAHVADALEYAHQQGILHRDIKPSNLLLDTQGTVWVADFGLAKADDQPNITHTGDILGTLRYMPPEAFEGKTDRRGDVYSLGLTLYELLSLRPAYDERDRHQLIKQVTTEEPTALEQRRRDIPRDLATIVHKAIDREPAHRYATAGDLAADLQRFVDDEPIQARRISTVERLGRWCRRNPALATLTATVAALLLLVGLGGVGAALHFEAAATRETALKTAADDARLEAEQQKRDSHERLVRLHVNTGTRLLDDNDVLSAVAWFAEAARLDAADNRRTEVHRLRLAAALARTPKLTQLFRHERGVTGAEFSPDGTRVLTASEDRTAKLWDVATGRLLATLRHDVAVLSGNFSPDGQRILTRTFDAHDTLARYGVQVWEAGTGALVARIRPDAGEAFGRCVFLPDGRHIATTSASGQGTNPRVQLWDVATGRAVISVPWWPDGNFAYVAMSPDGRRVLTARAGGAVELRNVADGKQVVALRDFVSLTSALFSRDSQRVVTVDKRWNSSLVQYESIVRICDTTTGKPLTPPLRHDNYAVNSLSLSKDGRRLLVAANECPARVWDTTTGRQLVELPVQGQPALYQSAELTADGHRAVTTGGEFARIWDADTGRPLLTLRLRPEVWRASFSPDAKYLLVAGSEGTARLWDLTTTEGLTKSWSHNGGARSVAFSPDGACVLLTGLGQPPQTWDAVAGQPTGPPLAHPAVVECVAFSRDGTLAVTGGRDRTARIWNTATGASVCPPLAHERIPTFADFSPDGRRVVTTSGPRPPRLTGDVEDRDETDEARVWDTASGALLLKIAQPDRIKHAAFSPDGRWLATGSADGTACVWDLATGAAVSPVLRHATALSCVDFSPDGKRLLTACSDSSLLACAAQVWDIATGLPATPPLPHNDGVLSAVFSPDGRWIATSGEDHTARVWDAVTGQPRTPLLKHLAWHVTRAIFSPDGRLLLTACRDGTVRVWDAATGEAITAALHLRNHYSGWEIYAAFGAAGRRFTAVSSGGEVQTWELPADTHAVEDAGVLAQVLTGARLDEQVGFVPLTVETLGRHWDDLHGRRPEDFTRSRTELLAWLRQQAQAALSRKEPTAALTHLERVLELEPTAWLDWLRRSRTHAELAHWDQASAALDRAIELGATHGEVWIHKAEMHANRQQWPAVLDALDRAAAVGEAGTLYWYWRATAHTTLKQWDQAIAACNHLRREAEALLQNKPSH